jgi:hypothetical protein
MSRTLDRVMSAFVLLLCLWWSSVAYPGVNFIDPQIETIKGLQGIYVFVGVDSGAEGTGLNKDQVRTDVELRLRRNGIKVLTIDEARRTPGAPFFFIRVEIRQVTPNLYCYNIDADLSQLAILHRNEILPITNWDSTVRVTTYKTGFLGTAKNTKEIRETIEDTVNKFSNDFLSVNPK